MAQSKEALEAADRKAWTEADQSRLNNLELGLRDTRELLHSMVPIAMAVTAMLAATIDRLQPDEHDRRVIAKAADKILDQPDVFLPGYKRAYQKRVQRHARDLVTAFCRVPGRRRKSSASDARD